MSNLNPTGIPMIFTQSPGEPLSYVNLNGLRPSGTAISTNDLPATHFFPHFTINPIEDDYSSGVKSTQKTIAAWLRAQTTLDEASLEKLANAIETGDYLKDDI